MWYDDERLDRIEKDGYRAFAAQANISCPFDQSSAEAKAWRHGWLRAKHEFPDLQRQLAELETVP